MTVVSTCLIDLTSIGVVVRYVHLFGIGVYSRLRAYICTDCSVDLALNRYLVLLVWLSFLRMQRTLVEVFGQICSTRVLVFQRPGARGVVGQLGYSLVEATSSGLRGLEVRDLFAGIGH